MLRLASVASRCVSQGAGLLFEDLLPYGVNRRRWALHCHRRCACRLILRNPASAPRTGDAGSSSSRTGRAMFGVAAVENTSEIGILWGIGALESQKKEPSKHVIAKSTSFIVFWGARQNTSEHVNSIFKYLGTPVSLRRF